ncbi:MAG: HD domain-containing protein [Nitrospirae bacterium]|nr:HD domain-containing protein [Nitrospirota bacterium]MBF0541674.1 HD domain-containing protein [Nitrospirota bacterium]
MTYEKQEELKKVLVRLVPRARNDRDFRKKLLRDTLNTITEQGINVPDEVKITILQDTKDSIYLVLPLDRDEQIKKIVHSHNTNFLEPIHNETKQIIPKHLEPIAKTEPEINIPIDEISDTPQTIFGRIEKIESELDEIFNKIDSIEDITSPVLKICDNIQEICDINEDAVIAWVMMDELFNKSCALYNYSLKHAVHCALICELITKRNNLPIKERKFVIAAALTMNISMTYQNDKLFYSLEDLLIALKVGIKPHPVRGAMLLEKKGVKSPLWRDIVVAHHEMPDGTGYPKGLICQDIIPAARIVSLADIFCSRVTASTYKSGLKPSQAVNEIFLKVNKNIEENIAVIFIKIIGTYPPGTLVLLANDEIAIVTRKGETTNTPIVYSVINPENKPLVVPIKRDCAIKEFAIKKVVPYSEIDITINKDLIWEQEF